jgi:ribosomal protein S27E
MSHDDLVDAVMDALHARNKSQAPVKCLLCGIGFVGPNAPDLYVAHLFDCSKARHPSNPRRYTRPDSLIQCDECGAVTAVHTAASHQWQISRTAIRCHTCTR